MESMKSQAPSTKSQGFRCRVSGVREKTKTLKPETSTKARTFTGKAIEL